MSALPLDAGALFNKQKCYGLNIDNQHPFSVLLDSATSGFTKSDSDEQLVLSFAFNETTALTGFKIEPASAGDDSSSAPRKIKVYLNLVNFTFDDVDNLTPAAVVEITDLSSVVQLKQVTFNRVNSITLFVETNQGETEYTSLSQVKFFGKSLGGTDVAQLKKQQDEE